MAPEVLIVVKFLLWLQRQGVKITIAAMQDRVDDSVYKTPSQMVDLAARWFAQKGKDD